MTKEASETGKAVAKTADSDQQTEAVADENREKAADLIVDKYTKWSFGIGFIPAPVVDLVALTGVQLKMLDEIARVYGQSFNENKVRSILSALISGALPQTSATAGVSSFLKGIPVLGTAVGLAIMPIASAAATYAVGCVFIKHFESGGTFLDIDIKSMLGQVKETASRYRKDKKKEQDKSTEKDAKADVA